LTYPFDPLLITLIFYPNYICGAVKEGWRRYHDDKVIRLLGKLRDGAEIPPFLSYLICLKPILTKGMSCEDFSPNWCPKILETLRKVRNALVHGKEKRMAKVISPTPRNDILIQPLIAVVRRTAEQVILFGSSSYD